MVLNKVKLQLHERWQITYNRFKSKLEKERMGDSIDGRQIQKF